MNETRLHESLRKYQHFIVFHFLLSDLYRHTHAFQQPSVERVHAAAVPGPERQRPQRGTAKPYEFTDDDYQYPPRHHKIPGPSGPGGRWRNPELNDPRHRPGQGKCTRSTCSKKPPLTIRCSSSRPTSRPSTACPSNSCQPMCSGKSPATTRYDCIILIKRRCLILRIFGGAPEIYYLDKFI